MYAAIAGLRTHMQNLNVIGNNVANVNTNGYKASRSVFKTSLYTTLTGGSDGTQVMGGINPSQIGYGSNIATIDIDMSTGNYSPTGKSTDCMLDGDGFFLVGDKDIAGTFDGSSDDVAKLTSLKLTRVGDFEFKADGYFGKNDGNCVYGFQCIGYYTQEEIDAGVTTEPAGKEIPVGTKAGDPKFSDQLVPIRFPRVRSVTSYTVTTPGQNGAADTTATWVLTGQTTDNNGNTTYNWEVRTLDANNVMQTTQQTTTTPQPATPQGGSVKGSESMEIVYPKETSGGLTEEEDLSMGQFQLITVDQNTGLITGVSNETKQVVTIGCVAVGMVTNPNGVTNMGSNYYKASEGSGDLTIAILGGNAEAMGITQINKSLYMPPANAGNNGQGGQATVPTIDGLRPRSGGETKMLSSGLEMSKTDLAQEIANMILTQRGYQANTRIITVTDSMLEELVNMKR